LQTVLDIKLTNASLIDYSNMPGADGIETGLAFTFQKVTLTDRGLTTEGTAETAGANAMHFANTAPVTSNTVTQVPGTSPVHYFLKVGGVTGDSTDKDHKGWFEIDGFDFARRRQSHLLAAHGGYLFR
jgi:type VI protein secretion system component Hcp